MVTSISGTQSDTSNLETTLQQIGIKARNSASWSAVSSKVGSETHISITLADMPPAPVAGVAKEPEEAAPAVAQ